MRSRARLCLFATCLALLGCSKPTPKTQACTPPRDYWTKPHNFVGLVPVRNDLSLDRRGGLFWNGESISAEKLHTYLRATHQMSPEPFVFLQTEMGVSCDALEAVRKEMEESLECRKPYSACAEGILSVWRKLPSPPGAPVS